MEEVRTCIKGSLGPRGWETGRGAGGKILLPGLSKLRSVHVEIFLLPLNRPGNALAFPLPFGNVSALPLEELFSSITRQEELEAVEEGGSLVLPRAGGQLRQVAQVPLRTAKKAPLQGKTSKPGQAFMSSSVVLSFLLV